ncbi:flagellar assembly protein H [Yoonia vestfoldensis]|uniref:Flagellar assembly protein H n=2 Tax=Yoonia vestfoldensis TaxID=245188 RepID=A0A1Y0EH29_9RHOB|nr:flagellar assembly protein H [Yoonia vestfoldensis]
MKGRLFPMKASDPARDPQQLDLADLLAKTKDPAFALVDTASRQADQTFRRLSWAEIAVKISLETDLIQAEESAPALPAEPGAAIPEETLSPPPAPPQEGPPPLPEAVPQPAEAVPEPHHPPAPPVDEAMLQRIRDDAYAEGLSAGKAITQGEREVALEEQFTQLQQLTVSLGSEQVFDMDVVARSIEEAVLTLASERIGQALTDMPEPLLVRLDTLLDNLAHLLGTREVFVCPDDIPLLQKCLDTHPNPPLIYLRGDPTLQRGDARLRVGGAEVSDLLRDRATSLLRKTGAELA